MPTAANDGRVARQRRRDYREPFHRALDPHADEIVARLTDRGAPSYREEKSGAKFTRTHDTTGADAVPAASTDGWDFTPAGKATLYWKPGAAGPASHTSVTLTLYALTDLDDWVIIGTTAAIARLTEVVVDGVGYRRFAARITATVGGAAGNVAIYAAAA